MRPPSIPQRLHLIAEASPTHSQFRWQASLVVHASTLAINNSCPLTISNSITNVNQNPFQPVYDKYFHGNAFHMYLYHSFVFLSVWDCFYYLPRKQLSLTLYRALKNYEVPKVTQLLSSKGTFLNPGLGTPNPMFIPHHSSIHYRITHAFPFQRRQDNQQSWGQLSSGAQNCSLLDTPPRPEQPSPKNNSMLKPLAK